MLSLHSLFPHLLARTTIQLNPLPHFDSSSSSSTQAVQIIINLTFSVLGAVALLMIVIAGFRYIISQGDPQVTAKARNTIIYGLVGLAVVILARVLVVFVVRSLQ